MLLRIDDFDKNIYGIVPIFFSQKSHCSEKIEIAQCACAYYQNDPYEILNAPHDDDNDDLDEVSLPPGWTQTGARRGRGKEASRRARGRGVPGEGAGGSRGLGSSMSSMVLRRSFGLQGAVGFLGGCRGPIGSFVRRLLLDNSWKF